MSTSSRKRIVRLEVGALCAVLVLLVAVAGLARMGGEGAQASPSPSPPSGQAVAMKAAADLTPWTFTIDEAYAYGERACEDIRDPNYDGFGGFYMGVRKTWVAMRLDAHGLPSEEQVEHHRRLYAEAVPRSRRRRLALITALLVVGLVVLAGLTAARAVLFPLTDSPARVDAIVVVAGVADDRYVYARHLAESGVADRILVSQPSPGGDDSYSTAIDAYCENSPVIARDGRRVEIECFQPDVGTTEGETTAATRIARERGYDSLLVVTYWGHVSRVRIYFDQCFDGPVYVTDTPRPTQISRRYALLHETGGYFKAFLKPAC